MHTYFNHLNTVYVFEYHTKTFYGHLAVVYGHIKRPKSIKATKMGYYKPKDCKSTESKLITDHGVRLVCTNVCMARI